MRGMRNSQHLYCQSDPSFVSPIAFGRKLIIATTTGDLVWCGQRRRRGITAARCDVSGGCSPVPDLRSWSYHTANSQIRSTDEQP